MFTVDVKQQCNNNKNTSPNPLLIVAPLNWGQAFISCQRLSCQRMFCFNLQSTEKAIKKVKDSHSLVAVGVVEVRGPLFLFCSAN